MRVATHTFSSEFLGNLYRLNSRQLQLQRQASTGQRVTQAEDDPAALRRALQARTEARTLERYEKNITALTEQGEAHYEVVRGLLRVCNRAGEIATAANGLKSPEELRAYAAEVTQLIHQAAQTANGKHRGAFLMGGTRSEEAPFQLQLDADRNVTGVTYRGNASVTEVEIGPDHTLTVTAPGANSTGSGARGVAADPRFGADLFGHLVALQQRLAASDGAGAAATLEGLRRDEENLLAHVSQHGANAARLEATAAAVSRQALQSEAAISRDIDADLAETLVRLNSVQTAYQAALQSGAGVLRTSLLDFLH